MPLKKYLAVLWHLNILIRAVDYNLHICIHPAHLSELDYPRIVSKIVSKIQSGSGEPNKKKVAKITKAQVQEIAELKMPDLNAASLESAMSMIAGTARSMGVEVVD